MYTPRERRAERQEYLASRSPRMLQTIRVTGTALVSQCRPGAASSVDEQKLHQRRRDVSTMPDWQPREELELQYKWLQARIGTRISSGLQSWFQEAHRPRRPRPKSALYPIRKTCASQPAIPQRRSAYLRLDISTRSTIAQPLPRPARCPLLPPLRGRGVQRPDLLRQETKGRPSMAISFLSRKEFAPRSRANDVRECQT